MIAKFSPMEESNSNHSGTESDTDDEQENNFRNTISLMEESRKRKLSSGGIHSPEAEHIFQPPKKKKTHSPLKPSAFLDVAHGICFNPDRNKFEASVRVLNEETGNFDEFILGYFETKDWAVRVRDAWIVLHKVRNNKLNLAGKFDQKACAQVQKMNSVLREHIQSDTTKTKTMITLIHNMIKNEKILKGIVMKFRTKIAQIDRHSPLVSWMDREMRKVQPIKRPNMAKPQLPSKPKLNSQNGAVTPAVGSGIKVKRESIQGYWTIRTDGQLIKLFGKHGSNYEKIAEELRRRFSMPYDATMVDERISRLTKSIQKRVQPRRPRPGAILKLWMPQKDAMLMSLVKKFGEDYQFLSTAMGDEFNVRELQQRVNYLSRMQVKKET